MRIAVSSLAWDVADDEAVAAVLNAHGVDAVDLVPGKYFAGGAATPDQVRNWWAARGIAVTGLQALLFGTTGLNLFGDPAAQAAMLAHLETVCRAGAELGAPRLVFGSPRNRDRTGLSDAQALAAATSFFRRLGDVAGRHGVVVCLEPNPPRYGANFMTNSSETAEVVAATAHPAIRLQLDTGALAINGEDPEQVVRAYGDLIGHVHASEPDLVVLGDGAADHARAAAALRAWRPDAVVAIEMLPAKNEPRVAAVERAVAVAIRHYRTAAPGRGGAP